MATTLTRNLKLRIDSNLTANSKYNLERIDLLGSTFLVDSTNTLNIRSQTDLVLEPNSADLGGSGLGGTVSIGTPNHTLTSLDIYTDAMTLSTKLGLMDQAAGGTKDLFIQYKSDLNGSVDTSSDRTLSVDLDGADRNLVLGGSLSLLGGSITLNLSGTTSLTLPQSGTLSTLSGSETLTNKTINASSNTIEDLANANIASGAAIAYSKLNLASSILNSDISPSAAILYSKLALTDSIVNADIAAAAGIVYSKLSIVNSIQNSDINSAAAISYSKLNLAASIVNADVSGSAAISRSKIAPGTPGAIVINDGSGNFSNALILDAARGGTGVSSTATFPTSGVVVTESGTQTLTNKTLSGSSNTFSNISYSALSLTNSIVNADISAAAGIAYSKLNLTGAILNADVAAGAAIAGSKINPDFGNQTIKTLAGLEFSEGGYTTLFQAAQGGQSEDLIFQLPNNPGTNGQVLTTNGSGELDWVTVGGTGTVTSVDLAAPGEFVVSGNPVTTAGTLTLTKANQTANTVWAGPATGSPAQPAFRALTADDLPALTTDDIPEGVTNLYFQDERAQDAVGGILANSSKVSLTYSDGTPSITADIISDSLVNADISTSAAIALSKLATVTADRALQSDGSGAISVSATTATELGYVSGVTSAIQTQLNGKQATLPNFGNTQILFGDGDGVPSTDAAFTYTPASNTLAGVAILTDAGNVAIAPGGVNAILTLAADQSSTFLGTIYPNDTLVDRVVVTDGANSLQSSSVTTTELGYVSGVTSAIQTQLNGKQATGNYITALTGDVTASGPGSVAATIANNAITDVKVDAAAAIAVSKLAAGTDTYVLTTVAGVPTWAAPAAVVESYKTDWVTGDGTTKVVTHSLGTSDVMIQLFDASDGATIQVDSIVRTDVNTVTLTSTEAPASSWRILILAV